MLFVDLDPRTDENMNWSVNCPRRIMVLTNRRSFGDFKLSQHTETLDDISSRIPFCPRLHSWLCIFFDFDENKCSRLLPPSHHLVKLIDVEELRNQKRLRFSSMSRILRSVLLICQTLAKDHHERGWKQHCYTRPFSNREKIPTFVNRLIFFRESTRSILLGTAI